MFLKTFDEMLKEDIILPRLGLCEVFIMPVVWVENKNTDSVLGFVPFDSEESWYCIDSDLPPEFKN